MEGARAGRRLSQPSSTCPRHFCCASGERARARARARKIVPHPRLQACSSSVSSPPVGRFNFFCPHNTGGITAGVLIPGPTPLSSEPKTTVRRKWSAAPAHARIHKLAPGHTHAHTVAPARARTHTLAPARAHAHSHARTHTRAHLINLHPALTIRCSLLSVIAPPPGFQFCAKRFMLLCRWLVPAHEKKKL